MLLLLAGGVALVVDQGQAGGNQLWGLLALLLATVAWGADNTLFRSLAERDPGQVVLGKALLGASATTILALAGVSFGQRAEKRVVRAPSDGGQQQGQQTP